MYRQCVTWSNGDTSVVYSLTTPDEFGTKPWVVRDNDNRSIPLNPATIRSILTEEHPYVFIAGRWKESPLRTVASRHQEEDLFGI